MLEVLLEIVHLNTKIARVENALTLAITDYFIKRA